MRFLLAIIGIILSGCRTGPSAELQPLPASLKHLDPAVCRIKSPQIAGSLIPLGDNIGLTARHVYRQPVAWIDGKLSGLDALRGGEGNEVGPGDWVIIRANDTDLPAPDEIDQDHKFSVGSKVYLCGFPSATAPPAPSGPTLVPAVVTDTPRWVPQDVRSDELVFLDLGENKDLSGMSGGPVVVPDARGTGWRVVGMYLGEWRYGIWTRYIAHRLPREIHDVRPTVSPAPR